MISSAMDSAGLSLTVLFFYAGLNFGAPTAGTSPFYFGGTSTFIGLRELLLLGRSSSMVEVSFGTESSKSSG